ALVVSAGQAAYAQGAQDAPTTAGTNASGELTMVDGVPVPDTTLPPPPTIADIKALDKTTQSPVAAQAAETAPAAEAAPAGSAPATADAAPATPAAAPLATATAPAPAATTEPAAPATPE